MMIQSINESGSSQRLKIDVDGMHCAGCVGRVEKAIGEVEGVSSATVSLAQACAIVDGSDLDPDALVEVIRKRGFEASIASAGESVADQRTAIERRQSDAAANWKRRFLIGLSAWVPLAIIHWGSQWIPGLDHHGVGFWVWMMVGLSTVVQIVTGSAFYESAWNAARNRTTNMDTLVAIGATAAYGFSLAVFVVRLLGIETTYPLYFGESAGLLTLISLGHWLEARTTAAAGSAVRELLSLQPDETVRLASIEDREGTAIPSADIMPEDLMLVQPGQRIAVDGTIAHGTTSVDESVVTGESLPVDRTVGDDVVAGSMNLTGRLVVRATCSGRDTTIARIADLVREAQSSKAKIQHLADRVCAVFVPAVLVVAAITFLGWLFFGPTGSRFIEALVNATTVLVISCPCALGLATPTAVMVGSGSAARSGLLVKSANTLERCASVNTLMFDKTGTLTHGSPHVVHVTNDETLTLGAAVASGSSHPLSRAVVDAASERGMDVPHAILLEETAGTGVAGTYKSQRIRLVSLQAVNDLGLTISDAPPASSATRSVVLRDDEVVGVIDFEDEVREGAADTIAQLMELGVDPIMATGDRDDVAKTMAERVGIPASQVFARCSPTDKVEHVRRLIGDGRIVAMVGDGINDAAALAEAGAHGGVGVAIRAGTNIAIESADVVIPGEQLDSLPRLIVVSRLTLRTIKQNLFFSFIYNVLAIPAAAFGFLGTSGPLIAAAAMGLSDLCVVGNSLRLKMRLD